MTKECLLECFEENIPTDFDLIDLANCDAYDTLNMKANVQQRVETETTIGKLFFVSDRNPRFQKNLFWFKIEYY